MDIQAKDAFRTPNTHDRKGSPPPHTTHTMWIRCWSLKAKKQYHNLLEKIEKASSSDYLTSWQKPMEWYIPSPKSKQLSTKIVICRKVIFKNWWGNKISQAYHKVKQFVTTESTFQKTVGGFLHPEEKELWAQELTKR